MSAVENVTFEASFVRVSTSAGFWRRLWLAISFVVVGEMAAADVKLEGFSARRLS